MEEATIMKNTMKYILGLILLISSMSVSFGQQDPMYSQYMFNIQAYNPAYVGTWRSIGIMALSRQQWVGFEGAPETQTLTIQAPLKNDDIGVGLTVMNDNVGNERRFAFFTDYSYRFQLGFNLYMRLGLKAGFTNYSNNLQDYGLYVENGEHDYAFDEYIEKSFMPNFGVGGYLYSDNFYVGLSLPKILENDFELGIENYETNFETRHFTLIGGYVFTLSEPLKFKPSIIARYVRGSQFVGDLNLSFLLKEKFWMGAMVRTNGAYGAYAQFIANNKLRIGYAVDFETSKLKAYSGGTHEIMLSYELTFKKRSYTSPRYF